MNNDVMIPKSELITAINETPLSEIIKPLVSEIHLFDTFVSGTNRLEEPSVLGEIAVGDKLSLRRENNKFDSNAIIMLAPSGKKLGYIPEKDNVIFSRLMDAGKLLIGKVTDIESMGSFKKISVGIFLVDY